MKVTDLIIGGHSRKELLNILRARDVELISVARQMMLSDDFIILPKAKTVAITKISIANMRLSSSPTTNEVFTQASKMRLSLCPPELAVWQRLADTTQPEMNWYWVAMNPITDNRGYSRIFKLARGQADRFILHAHLITPDTKWRPKDMFVFVAET